MRFVVTVGDGDLLTGFPAVPGYTAHAVVTGATAIPRADLTAVEIRAADGHRLLILPG